MGHIYDFPNEIVGRITELGCETYPLDWYRYEIHGDNVSHAFPLFCRLRHPCITTMSIVCRQWAMAAHLVNKRLRFFMQLNLHAVSDKQADLVDQINVFVRALQSSGGIPLYVSLRFPSGGDPMVHSIRLFMHGVGKLLACAEQLYGLDLRIPRQEYVIQYGFLLLFALDKRCCQLVYVNIGMDVVDDTPLKNSKILTASLNWSLQLYQQRPFVSALSEFRSAGALLTSADSDSRHLERKGSLRWTKNRIGAAQCLQHLGDIKFMQNDYNGAREIFEEVRRELQSLRVVVDAVQCLQSLGDIKRIQGDYDGARTMLEEARKEFQSMGNRFDASYCLRSLGDIKYVQCDYEGAREMMEEARAEFHLAEDLIGVARCLRSLGDINYMQGNFEEGRTMLEEARNQFQSTGDRIGAARCVQRLGDVKFSQGDLEGAQERLETAKAEFQSMNDHVGAARCLRTLGDIKRIRGDHDGAQEMMEKAKNEWEAMPERIEAERRLRVAVLTSSGADEGSKVKVA